MKTGQIRVGYRQPNTNVRPTIYLEKHYPINNRKDFYKWAIVTPNGLHTDYKGEVMYFDSFNFQHARNVLKAVRKTNRLINNN